MSKKKESKFKKFWFYDINKTLGYPTFLLAFRPKRYFESDKCSRKIKGPAIIVSNHNAFIDAFLINFSYPCRRHFVLAAKEVAEANKFFTWFSKKLLSIKVDRNLLSIESYRQIMNTLKEGRLVDIFAEGHVTEEEFADINQFFSGPVYFALKSGAPIIPIYLKRRKNGWERVKFMIGEPINLKELGFDSKDKIEEATTYLYNKEIALKNKLMEIEERKHK